MRTALVCLIFLLSAHAAAAADNSPFRCKRDGNQQEMNACAARDYKAADKALNRKYKEVLAALSKPEQERLRAEQRAWVKNRDPHCKAEVKDSEGGSIYPLELLGCLRSLTEKRTKELARWARK